VSITLGWILLALVVINGRVVVDVLIRRIRQTDWPKRKKLVALIGVTVLWLAQCSFVGFALAHFGVQLLGVAP
jgi:hypothetical protein